MMETERPPAVLVTRTAVQNERGRLLLVRRSETDNNNAGLWEFPGGKVDEGQPLVDAQVREFEEETGLLIEPMSSSVLIDSRVIPDGKYAGMLYVILCGTGKILSGDVKLSDEHTAAMWVPRYTQFEFVDWATPETAKSVKMLGELSLI